MVAIIRRAAWGAQFTIPGGRHVPLSARRWFVCHWPASAGRITDDRAVVRAIERQHRQGQGWAAAPGYNFLVGRTGIYEGCGMNVRGIHSPPRNTDGFGVCLLVGMGEPLPDAVLRNTRALYDWLNRQAGRTLGQTFHGQHWATACAGQAINNWVRAGMRAPGGAAPAPPSPPRPRFPLITILEDPMMLEFFNPPGDALPRCQLPIGNQWQDGNARVTFTCSEPTELRIAFPGAPQSTSATVQLGINQQRRGTAIPRGQNAVTVRRASGEGRVYCAFSRNLP